MRHWLAWPFLASALAATSTPRLNSRLKSGTEMIVDDDIQFVPLKRISTGLRRSELKITSHSVRLERANTASLSSAYVEAMRRKLMAKRGMQVSRLVNGSTELDNIKAGTVFLAPITVGNQNFQVVIDTGSSDPWLAEADFTCRDVYTGEAYTDNAACDFFSTYDPAGSSTFSRAPNQNFNVSYADGEFLNGDMGTERMTFAQITVPRQKFGVVDDAAWFGDGISSGLVGFAYGSLTSAYTGDNPHNDVTGQTVPYDPLFVTMYKDNLIAPVFSMAISRNDSEGGVLSVGGIPDIAHGPAWANVPIQPVGVNYADNTPNYEFYSVICDGFAVSADQNAQFNLYAGVNNPKKTSILANQTSTIIDSGTSLAYVPDEVAEAVANAFDPPAQWSDYWSAWVMPCDPYTPDLGLKPPKFGVAFDGKLFFANPQDMYLYVGQDDLGYNTCYSAIQPDFGGYSLLGDVWMKSVLVVFDIGASEMRFAEREHYDLHEVSKPATT